MRHDRATRGCERRFDEAHRARRASSTATSYAARLALELGVIQKMGFSGYFLIVWDFIR